VSAPSKESRLRALVDAGIAVSSELSLDGALQRIVEAAASLTGSRYAALGVLDVAGTRLARFFTTGIDPEQRAAIGDLPHGRGILGVLIDDAVPLRLRDLAEHPQSIGFPANHPPMRSFLGAPILLRGVAYGNIYLTEKAGGVEFDAEDEELVTLLAAQAAVAIENARLYESATRWSRQLESLNEVGNALVTETELEPLLRLVCERLRSLLEARIVSVALPLGDGRLRFAAAAGEGAAELEQATASLRTSKNGRVLERMRSERIDSLIDDPEVDQDIARRLGLRAGLFVPLVAHERAIGVIAVHDKVTGDGRFSDDDLRLAETFAARAAVAVDLSQRVARDALRRVVAAQELERRRLARELHDETGQALTSVLLGLKAVEEAGSPEEMRAAGADLRELVVQTLQDVRRLAVELRPRALDDFGLVPALERLTGSLAEHTGIAVDFESALGDERLPSELETALYRVVQESLTNIVKHARATRASVLVARREGEVVVVIEDDGAGFDPGLPADGIGLLGMRERAELVEGTLTIETREGGGTTIIAEVPVP
jgi:signal transduction histidine kinase